MGATCSKASSYLRLGAHLKKANHNEEVSKIVQILLLGLPSTGKTTLLYGTYITDWNDIAAHVTPTSSFHYEEIILAGYRFGLWEVSGSLEELWTMFYRSILFDVVIYVVSAADTSKLSMQKNRRWIRFFLNEDELKSSLICVLINKFNIPMEDNELEKFITNLGLRDSDLPLQNTYRLTTLVVDAKDGIRDAAWYETLTKILESLHRTV